MIHHNAWKITYGEEPFEHKINLHIVRIYFIVQGVESFFGFSRNYILSEFLEKIDGRFFANFQKKKKDWIWETKNMMHCTMYTRLMSFINYFWELLRVKTLSVRIKVSVNLS